MGRTFTVARPHLLIYCPNQLSFSWELNPDQRIIYLEASFIFLWYAKDFHLFFFLLRIFLLVKNTLKISRKISYNRNPVNDHLRDVAEKPPPIGEKSHDQCWDIENPIFVLLQQH
jgi:hypothetical protein